jgi:zeta-carotene isomerase
MMPSNHLSLLLLLCIVSMNAYDAFIVHQRALHPSFSVSLVEKRPSIASPVLKHGPPRSSIHMAEESNTLPLVGDDSAKFDLSEQSLKQWTVFGAAVATVLSFLYGVWLWEGGPQLGNQFKDMIEGLANGDTTLSIVYMLGFFAVMHSGLASLRPAAEEIIGPRAWRVIFALVSLPLAFSSIVYFINHRFVAPAIVCLTLTLMYTCRYDGTQLWDFRLLPGMHDFVFWSSLISFYFLYPSTFNLLEVG